LRAIGFSLEDLRQQAQTGIARAPPACHDRAGTGDPVTTAIADEPTQGSVRKCEIARCLLEAPQPLGGGRESSPNIAQMSRGAPPVTTPVPGVFREIHFAPVRRKFILPEAPEWTHRRGFVKGGTRPSLCPKPEPSWPPVIANGALVVTARL
jgi:hypothetical protein